MGWGAAIYDLWSSDAKPTDEGGKSCRGRFRGAGKNWPMLSSRPSEKGMQTIISSLTGGGILFHWRSPKKYPPATYFFIWALNVRSDEP